MRLTTCPITQWTMRISSPSCRRSRKTALDRISSHTCWVKADLAHADTAHLSGDWLTADTQEISTSPPLLLLVDLWLARAGLREVLFVRQARKGHLSNVQVPELLPTHTIFVRVIDTTLLFVTSRTRAECKRRAER